MFGKDTARGDEQRVAVVEETGEETEDAKKLRLLAADRLMVKAFNLSMFAVDAETREFSLRWLRMRYACVEDRLPSFALLAGGLEVLWNEDTHTHHPFFDPDSDALALFARLAKDILNKHFVTIPACYEDFAAMDSDLETWRTACKERMKPILEGLESWDRKKKSSKLLMILSTVVAARDAALSGICATESTFHNEDVDVVQGSYSGEISTFPQVAKILEREGWAAATKGKKIPEWAATAVLAPYLTSGGELDLKGPSQFEKPSTSRKADNVKGRDADETWCNWRKYAKVIKTSLQPLYFDVYDDPLELTWGKFSWGTHIKAHLAFCKMCGVTLATAHKCIFNWFTEARRNMQADAAAKKKKKKGGKKRRRSRGGRRDKKAKEEEEEDDDDDDDDDDDSDSDDVQEIQGRITLSTKAGRKQNPMDRIKHVGEEASER